MLREPRIFWPTNNLRHSLPFRFVPRILKVESCCISSANLDGYLHLNSTFAVARISAEDRRCIGRRGEFSFKFKFKFKLAESRTGESLR
jgi:hypothetical protein